MNLSITDMIERIKSITELKELESIGISAGTISAWKVNNRPPRSDDLLKIATKLNVTMEYLLTGKDFENKLANNELELLSNYRSLDAATKKNVDLMVEALAGK